MNEMAKAGENLSDKEEEILKSIYLNKIEMRNKIRQHYGFSFVDFDTIFYPDDKNVYTTIEVITKNDNDRLRFVNEKIKPSSQKPKHDLIEKMMEYQTTWGQLVLSKQIDTKTTVECPVYHCIHGFTHPKLKDNFALFNARANKEKELIFRTIKHDPNPERRTAAIYLMGHFNDPKEIISFLNNHITDPDPGVRNSAMRVIGLTMEKAKIHEIDVMPFLSLLDSPYDTDRNKALLVLLNATNWQKTKELIIQNGKDRLIALLRLKQPNNQGMAYLLLKQISGADFGPKNFEGWEQWFLKMQNTKTY